MKILMFSTHSLKYIWYSPQKSKYPLYILGLVPGDEILVINGKIVSELDMVYVETLLQDSHSVCLAVRALQMPPSAVAMETPVTCPPPPSQSRISENSIGNLKIPPPSGSKQILKTKFTNLSLLLNPL